MQHSVKFLTFDHYRFAGFSSHHLLTLQELNDIEEIYDVLANFRNERDWAQFQDSKNLAIAVGIEGAELNELFYENVMKSASKWTVRRSARKYGEL